MSNYYLRDFHTNNIYPNPYRIQQIANQRQFITPKCKKAIKTTWNNSNNYTCQKFQSYGPRNFGKVLNYQFPVQCKLNAVCQKNQNQFNNFINKQQDLYALMRRKPELFPIVSWVKENGLYTYWEKRQYSNNWYRQFGTSQALPVNDNWGGFYLPGSETPFTD